MASGIGPNLILPGGSTLWKAITGQDVRSGPGGNWFGTNPMAANAGAIDWGKAGGWSAYGPQSTQYQRSGFPLGDPAGAGLNAALFGSSYNPAFGQSAYDRFADVGDSYLRRYGTDVRVDPAHPNVALQPELDAQGNGVGFGQGVKPNPAYYSDQAKLLLMSPERNAGLRSAQSFGGRDPNTGAPISGTQSDIFKTMIGHAQLQQAQNPFLQDPATAANMQIYSELSSPFTRGNPQDYLRTAQSAEIGPQTGQVADRYVNQMQGLGNRYERDLLNRMAQEGSKDLSLGIEDARGQLSAMGLGRSGQGQSTAGGIWSDIQQRNALDRQNIMAQFAEANAGRTGQAVMGAQGAAAAANEARLARMNAAAMGGQQALTGSLEASRAAQRGGLQQGMQNTLAWNQGVQGNALQAMLGGDQAMLQRMIAESNAQSQGLRDYTGLQNLKDQMYYQRQGNMIDLEDRQRAQYNAVLNQMAYYNQLGGDRLMQMITGIAAPTGGAPARANPWPSMLGGAGLNLASNYIGQMGQPTPQTNYGNMYQPVPGNEF